MGPKNPFNASGDITAMADFVEGGKLICKGFKIDTMDGLGCTCWLPNRPEHDTVQPFQRHHAYASKEGLDTALWRTLVANRSGVGERAPDRYQNLLEIPLLSHGWPYDLSAELSYNAFNKFRECNSSISIFGNDFSSYFFYEPHQERLDITMLDFMYIWNRATNVLVGRRLATTDRDFVGLVPKRAQQGDSIWILLGCSVPVALQPFGDCYKLVGEDSWFNGIRLFSSYIQSDSCDLSHPCGFNDG